ncbi:MAG: efflux RND transporter periplasmic adaptor subunit, partial [Clostridia bacterium]|nr:efflux RND transporter periplasmic adaptor subunit [Clostridia bacterium]
MAAAVSETLKASSPRWRRFLAWGLVAALLLATGGAALRWRIATAAAERQATPRFQAETVQRGTIRVEVTATGTVAAARRANVTAEVAGTVTAVHFEDGQAVRAGDLLVELANEDLASQVETAALDLENARLRLAQMLRLDPERALVAPPEEWLTLRSPGDGRLVGLLPTVGQQIQQGQVVARLVRDGSLLFRALVNRDLAEQVRPGLPVEVRLDTYDGQLAGQVVEVAADTVTTETGIFREVQVELRNPGVLEAGQAGQVSIGTSGIVARGETDWVDARTIEAPVGGVVEKLFVRNGQKVQAGTPLLRLANDALVRQVEAERLNIRQAEIRLADRRRQVEKLAIRAPISGVVTAHNVEVGDTIGTGGQDRGTPLATILDTSAMSVTVPVDELDIPRIRVGQEATVTVEALAGRTLRGRVAKVAAEGQGENGVTTFGVTVDVETVPELRPGMTATVRLVVAEKANTLLVPAEAVLERPGGPVVERVEGDRLVTVPVTLGLRNERWAEVLGGLSEGDRVAVAVAQPRAGSGPPGGAGFPGLQRGGAGGG